MDKLITAIKKIRDSLRKGAIHNEREVSQVVVMPVLRSLGWDTEEPERVRSEFQIEKGWVDHALMSSPSKHRPSQPIVLIEVKDVGKLTDKGENQLFDYCYKSGVSVAVLTDGAVWNFYYGTGSGPFEQRRIAMVNLDEDQIQDGARKLSRYLAFHTVTSRDFHKNVGHDHQIRLDQLEAAEHFPAVLESLVVEDRFLALFCAEVEQRCKIRPQETNAREFLHRALLGKPTPVRVQNRKSRKLVPDPARPSYTFGGKTTSCKMDKDVLLGVLAALQEKDAEFCGRLAPRLTTKKRNYLSRDPHRIYPEDAKEKVRGARATLPGGWWLGTNSSTKTKNDQLKAAREVAGLSPDQLRWQLKGKT